MKSHYRVKFEVIRSEKPIMVEVAAEASGDAVALGLAHDADTGRPVTLMDMESAAAVCLVKAKHLHGA